MDKLPAPALSRTCPFCETPGVERRCHKCDRDPTARRLVCKACHKMTPFGDPVCCRCGAKPSSSKTLLVVIVVVIFVLLNIAVIIARAS